MDEQSKKEIKFPCPDNNHEYVSLYDCENNCNKNYSCDTYLTMDSEDI